MPSVFFVLECSTQNDCFFFILPVILAYSVDYTLYANTKRRETMGTTQKMLEQLTGKQIVRELEVYLEEKFETFLVVHSRYINAIAQLRKELGAAISPSVDDLMEAIDKQTASNLLFSGALGIKFNLDHFIDPMARTVLDVDFPVFLREETAMRLPEYVKAQENIDAFFALLTSAQKELFEDIIEYISYMETTGPKLAHYYGYIMGNDILHNLVPGYHPDNVLTMQYNSMLADYWGIEGGDLKE